MSFSYINFLMNNKFKPRTRESLENLIKIEMQLHGNNCDLTHIDVSKITNMSELFLHAEFNGNISTWNVSNVVDMCNMFAFSKFDNDISQWDTAKVTDMSLAI